MKFDLTVVIPTFNEEENIGRMITTVNEICLSNNICGEIFVVDDSSQDKTIPIVKSMIVDNPNIRLFVRTENPGLSQSIYDGIRSARADIILCIDCDFSHPPEKIPIFYDLIKNNGFDIVLGTRYSKGGSIDGWTVKRKVISFGATVLGRLLIPSVSDPVSGYFAVRKQVIEKASLQPKGYKILLEILGKGNWGNVEEIPIVFKDREFGKSKLNSGIIWDFVSQCCSILYCNFITMRTNNIIRAWKIYLFG